MFLIEKWGQKAPPHTRACPNPRAHPGGPLQEVPGGPPGDVVPATQFHIHPREAKTRFYHIVFSLLLALASPYRFADEAIHTPAKPSQEVVHNKGPRESHSTSTDSTEGSLTQIQVSLFITFHLSTPAILYQIRLLIKPGSYLYERSAAKAAFT